jgi:NDP-sugar pyrophosphorylase family protein
VPIIEYIINRLIASGITDITLSLGHMAELIKAYFDHRQSVVKQISLRYVQEEIPTGTAGSLALIPGLDDTFLVLNGDLLTNIDFRALLRFHQQEKAILTIATQTRHVKIDLGVLEFDQTHQVTRYLEKPENKFHVSMGIYVYEPEILNYIAPGQHLDFPDLVLRLIAQGKRVCAYPCDCLWLDIGNPSDYAKAQEMVAANKEAFNLV